LAGKPRRQTQRRPLASGDDDDGGPFTGLAAAVVVVVVIIINHRWLARRHLWREAPEKTDKHESDNPASLLEMI
jgi:hypothetical protein